MKKNPLLFFPDLIFLFIAFAAGVIVLTVSGLHPYLKNIAFATEEEFVTFVRDFFAVHVSQIFAAAISFFLVAFLAGATTSAAKFGMISDVVHNKKISFASLKKCIRKYWLRIIGVRITLFVMYTAPLAISLLLAVFLPGMVEAEKVNDVVVGVLFVVVLALFLMIFLGSFFRYPLLYRDASPFQALKESFLLFNKNRKYVIMTAIIVVFTTAFSRVILDILVAMAGSFKILSTLASFIFIGVWVFTSIFLFSAYNSLAEKNHGTKRILLKKSSK